MKKFIPFFILLVLLNITSCKDDNNTDGTDPYDVEIIFETPNENAATVDLGSTFPVKIILNHLDGGVIYNVKIQLLQENDAVYDTLIEQNVQRNETYTYNNTIYMSPSEYGTYKLKVETTDNNGSHKKERTLNIFVQ